MPKDHKLFNITITCNWAFEEYFETKQKVSLCCNHSEKQQNFSHQSQDPVLKFITMYLYIEMQFHKTKQFMYSYSKQKQELI